MLTAYVKQVISRTISLAHTDSQTLTKLLQPAARAQCVPASSTLVQCVFSQGGIILKPHFARLSDILLSKLVFLKRNNHSNMQ